MLNPTAVEAVLRLSLGFDNFPNLGMVRVLMALVVRYREQG